MTPIARHNPTPATLPLLLILAALSPWAPACSDSTPLPDAADEETTQDAGAADTAADNLAGTEVNDGLEGTERTHSNDADPEYSTVFAQDTVLRFDIEISADNWERMQSDLADNLGSSDMGVRPGMGGGAPLTTSDYTPIWVPCTVKFNGNEWHYVGIRYKGNSSLRSAYQSGNNKLSFKLDFDQFEDDYPETLDQRFYGFKQLNLNNNFDDPSLMREKVGADLFRAFGLVAPQTAFCAVYVDHGDGPQYYGVYTLVEEVDDTVLDSQFADGSGNLYKPEGDAATFAYGTFDTDEMYLKTNEDEATYADVRALYDALHSAQRTTDPAAWKAELEAVFNVDGFLKWLAANTVMQNWDTYGKMSHNYYLYNNPEDNRLTWIPWDNNEALKDGKQGGALSLSLSEVGDDWPLISYLLEQDDYRAVYNQYVNEFVTTVFTADNMIPIYTAYSDLLKDFAYAEESGYSYLTGAAAFDIGVMELQSHVQSRATAVQTYLATQGD